MLLEDAAVALTDDGGLNEEDAASVVAVATELNSPSPIALCTLTL
jgi:hypothetical protein